MNRRNRITLFLTAALTLFIGAMLLFSSWKEGNTATKFPAFIAVAETRAKAIDTAANVPLESNQSASTLVTLLRASEDLHASKRKIMRDVGVILMVLGLVQVFNLWPMLINRRSKSVNKEN